MKDMVKILVVDDNSDLLNTFALILKRQGYIVDTAEDGRQAVLKFRTHQFDIVLMDVVMPNMDGIEALHQMKAIDPGPKIILMTAYCEEEQLQKVVKEGAYKALYKPINTAKLMSVLMEASANPTILIVDDDDDFRNSTARTLELMKCKVQRAASGEEAIAFAKQNDVQIALIDIKMQLMDGLTTSIKLKEIKPDLLILLMTGYRDEVQEMVDKATGQLVFKCLYKPFDVTKVKELVGR